MLSCESENRQVIGLDCSYHMCQRKKYFKTLKLEQGGLVPFGDNKACKVYGIDTTKLKMFDDHEFILHGVRYVL